MGELFSVPKERSHRQGGDFSGGQQQLAIGLPMMIEPRLLILVKPGEGIRPNTVARIREVSRKLIEE
ncbi:hypothetical protein [Marinobacter vinifirmus]|uniref:hypothetical protein n=1 Tax=Marinobacter vinifirmus TaxID=355591 RepID=UPI0023542D70|nr:hypothetical protein [Marinobacter vinifirmus]